MSEKKAEMPEFYPDMVELDWCPSNRNLLVGDAESEGELYLRADKVRELVRLHEDFRDLLLKYRFTPGVPDELNAKAEEIDNLQSALFPEGLKEGE